MKTLVKNGTIVTSTNEFAADILIEDEKISMIASHIDVEADTVIDAAGKYVLPGGVDNHSHFEALNTDGVTTNAGYDTTWVALKGGTTTIVDFCTNEPGMDMMESLEYRLNVRSKGKLAPDMAIHAVCTDFRGEETLDEIPKLVEAGVPTMKLFLAYKPTPLYMDDYKYLRFLERASQVGMTMMVHAENPDVLDYERNKMAEAAEDLRIDTYRSSGAGGQHVNKTDSAIRITHLPTNIVVTCQNERSQHQNKEMAMKILMSKLAELKEQEHKENLRELKGDYSMNTWGSQIRSYVFQPYTMVKDHRTGAETANVGAVMDGDLDYFINEKLKHKE